MNAGHTGRSTVLTQAATAVVLTLGLSLASRLISAVAVRDAMLGVVLGAAALSGGVAVALSRTSRRPLAAVLSRNLETGPNWRWRRFGAVLVPGYAAIVGMAVALDVWGNRAWGALEALQVPMIKLPSGFQQFADLAQFTDASRCARPVVVGTVVCDRLNRPLNQNPLFVSVLGPISSHISLIAFGTIIATVAVLLIAFLASRSPSGHLIALPLLFSPAAALAFERANAELVILLLAAPGLILLVRRNQLGWVLGAALLTLAAILKVYPAFALLPFIAIRPVKRALVATGGCVTVLGYWLLHLHTLREMLAVTERGSMWSYGLNAIFSPRAPLWLVAILFALVIVLALTLSRTRTATLASWNPESQLAMAFSLFFLLSFFAGANWSYRLIFSAILIPTPLGPKLLRCEVVIALLLAWLSPTIASAPAQFGLAVAAAVVLLVGFRRLRWLGVPRAERDEVEVWSRPAARGHGVADGSPVG